MPDLIAFADLINANAPIAVRIGTLTMTEEIPPGTEIELIFAADAAVFPPDPTQRFYWTTPIIHVDTPSGQTDPVPDNRIAEGAVFYTAGSGSVRSRELNSDAQRIRWSECPRLSYRSSEVRCSRMPRTTIVVGSALILLGVAAWAITSFASWTALIPAIIGLVLLILGLLAAKTGKQKLFIHIALLVALIGIAGTVSNTLKLGEVFAGTAERPAAVITSAITLVLLVVYLVLGIRSFVRARRWKQQEA